NALLLFLIPVDAHDIAEEYRILLGELERYNPELLHKKRLVAFSKIDLLDDELLEELEEKIAQESLFSKIPYLFISAMTQQNITQLKDKLWEMLNTD
ncbi:MAG: GTPase ObgE, partial [Flavobacteriaceae bacterium]|nr:GTPase ObgE [Flavobacteriaceae bacterium]